MSTSNSSNQNSAGNETSQRQVGKEGFSALASKPPTRHPEEPPLHQSAQQKERELINDGKMPGLSADDGKAREPGEVDAAGNKIHHKGVLGHIIHWEHDSMNADT